MALPSATDQNYQDWLTDLKERIRHAQLKAALAVNAELIGLYWQMGKSILNKPNWVGARKSSTSLREI